MKGRKPAATNVVPLTSSAAVTHNLDERARQSAADLRPKGLSPAAVKIWRDLAPKLAHPTVARLKPENAKLFGELCEAWARLDDLRATIGSIGETYQAETRNGIQIKSRPEVAQRNETFRQVVMLCDRFGMNPAAERGLRSGAQGDLFDTDDFDAPR